MLVSENKMICGYFSDKELNESDRKVPFDRSAYKIKSDSIVCLAIGMIAGLIVCYTFGTIWFYLVFMHNGETKSILSILGMCVVPFIIPDLVKMAAAVVLANRVSVPLKKMGFV